MGVTTDSGRDNHQISPHWSASLFLDISSNMLYALPAMARTALKHALARTHARPRLCEETALLGLDGGCQTEHAVEEGRRSAGREASWRPPPPQPPEPRRRAADHGHGPRTGAYVTAASSVQFVHHQPSACTTGLVSPSPWTRSRCGTWAW
ncbi:hypothetical protein VPH35_097866 [Triticum aestivum]